MEPLRVFIGYDHRQPVAYHVLCQSILSQSSKPVAFTPLVYGTHPVKRTGLTPFTFSRFIVPWLCSYKGWALFLDIDILVVDDIAKLFALGDDRYSVLVSKNEKRFEWASVMLFNNEKCKVLTPDYIESAKDLHTIAWAKEDEIGDLPREWNHLVGYDKHLENPSLIHYTQGIPAFNETNTCEHADTWHQVHRAANSATSWNDLMGKSVHAANVNGTLMPVYYVDLEKQAIREEFKEKALQLMGQRNGDAAISKT